MRQSARSCGGARRCSGTARVGHRPALGPPRLVPSHRSCIAAASTSGGLAVSQYLEKGPHSTVQLPPVVFSVGPNLDCTLRVFAPAGPPPPQRWPLLVLSAGFLLHSGLYTSYGEDGASWGVCVALYDLPEVVDDVAMVGVLGTIIDKCTSDPRLSPHVDARAVLLAGHSRGGKLSALAAARDPRVRGVALVDPVDVTAMTPTGPGYPSALLGLRTASGPPRRMPTLVIGAALNTDVIPADGNFRRFVANCPGPCWSVELQGAGHMQFVDMQVGLFSMFTKGGPTPDAVVRQVSKAAILSWALELAVPLARGEAASSSQVDRLKQTAEAMQRLAPLSSTLTGFGSANSSSSSGGSSSSSSGGSSSSSRASSGSGSGGSASSSSSAPGSGARTAAAAPPAASRAPWSVGDTMRYEFLMQMKARELKALLVAGGVACGDCFEKEDLARRLVETGVGPSVGGGL